MNTLRKHKHAVLLVALVWVGIMESFSHRRMLGPVLSDVTVWHDTVARFPDRLQSAGEPPDSLHGMGHRRCGRRGSLYAAELP